jgi:hypothetical protein
MGTAPTRETLPLTAVAQVAAADFRKGHEAVITPALAAELAAAIEIALLTAVRAERRGCSAECTRRAALWEATSEKPDIAEFARMEADCRANEALYLADLIATRA